MTNETKQTAVEWLVQQLQQTRDWQRVINEANQSGSSVRDVVQQAKEMEKEQRSIELPSDEEIEKANPFVFGSKHLGTRDMDIWTIGAQWMRDKIQGGNK